NKEGSSLALQRSPSHSHLRRKCAGAMHTEFPNINSIRAECVDQVEVTSPEADTLKGAAWRRKNCHNFPFITAELYPHRGRRDQVPFAVVLQVTRTPAKTCIAAVQPEKALAIPQRSLRRY